MGRKRRNQVFSEILIIDAGAKGKSIGKAPDGKIILVNNAVPGDIVTIQTTRKRKAYYEGTATDFHKLSDKRTTPKCPHFGTCGGCKWQHMEYRNQLFYKQNEIQNNLLRIAQIDLPELMPILPSDQIYFYRNKMEFSFSDNRWLSLEEINSEKRIQDKNALGFHMPGMWDKILDIDVCYLQRDPSNQIRNKVKEFALANNISFFDIKNQQGALRTLMIRTSSTGQIMVLIQFYEDDITKRNLLLDYIKQSFPEITSLLYVINKKGNDTIYDQDVICYHGEDHIIEKMEDLQFKIGPKSFYQTNSEQAQVLYEVTRNFADLTGNEIVYDLYTGTGTIAQFVAKKAKQVVGIESVPEAIEDAYANAKINNIENVKFFAGDMKKIFTDAFIEENGTPDVIITDPPRDGMHKDVIAQLLKIKAPKIVYVSCNSATQARDLALLDSIYMVTNVQPVDMFPQTFHCENVVLLKLRTDG
ncbi:23S rRNA (uracil(1939)-C(5))-methyltransferase RlmD [Aquimarina sp. ERC-38]|uniref:23S rRNA (uracil(1939)-C(5))-methyltransferase RlmD n=1 Tax=Aquimarina sp. ERC-38 TaxID=2949996 RepID=UPI0022456B62|nr:23S rRNA (uracil(1939)-C(5))-methyltransferase RlmD [Aquimarina sp. ERC-38]UZO79513.1 23S rRNA (uracil(1939)-C(5))-methyltransferase RlmD [Aquimarina sp. ERC-38]